MTLPRPVAVRHLSPFLLFVPLATACGAGPVGSPATSPVPIPAASASAPASVSASDAAAARAASATAARPPGPVIVALVIDQFAAWIARQRLATLPPDGGFARFLREGTYFKELAYAHAITETAPGHASLFTGVVPREHGIVANEVLGADGKSRGILSDPHETKVTLQGPVEGPGAAGTSLAALLKPVVADHFRERHGNSGYIAALSLKDRGSVFGAGRTADLALWFDPDLGTFVTSSTWGKAVPASLQSLVEHDAIGRLESEPWTPLDAQWLVEHANGDAAPGETDLDGFGIVFPHTATQSKKPGSAFRAEPRSDRLLLELGLKVLDEEARGRPTFLAISLSANDYIGHNFGPDSWEVWDELRRLDASLGWFFGELDRRFGPDGWSAALSGDHGVFSLPEKKNRPACGKNPLQAREPCGVGRRVAISDIEERARAAAKRALMDEKAIAGLADPYLYLAPTAHDLDAKARLALARALESELRKLPGVQTVLDVERFRGSCPDNRDESLEALVCRSLHPGLGGDFYIVLGPGSIYGAGGGKQAGTTHGSPYGYDRFVPLFVREPKREGSRGVVVEERRPFTEFHDALVRMIDRSAK
jgi:hypothetical protein